MLNVFFVSKYFCEFFKYILKMLGITIGNSDNPITQKAVVTSNLNNVIVAKIK